MPSIKDLKKRIGTVKNTQQTTKAMKMVSAAKLRRAQDAITSQRPYARQIQTLISTISAMAGEQTGSERLRKLLGKSEDISKEEGKKVLIVLVTSDRGLCGGFNSNAIKTAQRWLLANQAKYQRVDFAFVGRRGNEYFKTRKVNSVRYFAEAGGKVTFANAKLVSDWLVESYLAGQYDEVKFIYNEFKNAVTQKVLVEDYLPVKALVASAPEALSSSEAVTLVDYIVEPALPEVLEQLVSKNFAIQAFRILLDSQAGEHGARMSAMENATKNAGEMIRKLTLQFNKQRQASITKELLEIISGSESQKG